MTSLRWLAVLGFTAALAACGSPQRGAPAANGVVSGGSGSGAAAQAPAAGGGTGADAGAGNGLKIAFLGDSLTAGLGLLSEQAYPAVIGKQFASDGYSDVEVVNAGVSGDTTAGGLRRLDAALEPGVRIVVVALGGNDALRGLSPTQTHDNLESIIRGSQAKDVQVVLVGMLAPPNLGPDYRDAFAKTYTDLARQYKKTVTYVPFLLEGVAGDAALNQADGIHPTAAGAQIIAEHLYPTLRNLVDAMQ